MNRKTMLLAAMASTGVLFAAGTAAAAEVTIVRAGPALNAMKVVRDKDTGKLRAATAEEIAAMGNTPASAFAPNVAVVSRPQTTIVTRPDGSATIRRSLDDLDNVVAVKGADGKLKMGHHQGPAATQPLPKE